MKGKMYEIPLPMYEMISCCGLIMKDSEDAVKEQGTSLLSFHFVQPNGYFVHSHLCGFGSAGFFRIFALVEK